MNVWKSWFHPAVSSWFEKQFSTPTAVQLLGWEALHAQRSVVMAAPTGSGKTLAAFLCAIDCLVKLSEQEQLQDHVHILYVSPLKALSNDVERNLQIPLSGIRQELQALGHQHANIRVQVRTGDTPANERAKMLRKPPHILVTTPESLFILLTHERGKKLLANVRWLVVDEIHALMPNKRGSHLALSVERLQHLTQQPLIRIALSATQRPLSAVGHFLAGNLPKNQEQPVLIDCTGTREMDLAIELPSTPLESAMTDDKWEELVDRLRELILEHKTTLIFVNTRELAERISSKLAEDLGQDAVTPHHGSLAKEHRLQAEQRLKSGQLQALVATASLELGIDIGSVDLVCQIGQTRTIAAFLQRVGRSEHQRDGVPKGRIFPLNREELVELVAMLDAVKRGEIERLPIPECPVDILSQHIISACADQEWPIDELHQVCSRAWPFRDLNSEKFRQVLQMLAEGYSSKHGRTRSLILVDAVHQIVKGKRGSGLAAMTSGGAIPDVALFEVFLVSEQVKIGNLSEEYALGLSTGDVFQLGNSSYMVLGAQAGQVHVQAVFDRLPNVPFWEGDIPARSDEFSYAVSRLRADVQTWLEQDPGRTLAQEKLVQLIGIHEEAARQLVNYLAAAYLALGQLPTQEHLVVERFFDEAGNTHLIIHAPLGLRVNRAWGLALRKRFCRSFNFELQAAVSENALLLSLGPTHSFELAEIWQFLNANSVETVLVQALLDSPLFATRWRWNTNRSLAVLRFLGGKKVAPKLQRIKADDLLVMVFPEQVACLENIVGDREIPDHPLVLQTIHDCLTEAMDLPTLIEVLHKIEDKSIKLLAKDLVEPSPLAAEVLFTHPHNFLDDAPAEERRTRAILHRRWLDPEQASDLSVLDPLAIQEVCREVWPNPTRLDEVHDALVTLGFVLVGEGRAANWSRFFDVLRADRRACAFRVPGQEQVLWVAAERLSWIKQIHPEARLAPEIAAVSLWGQDPNSREEAIIELLRARLALLGPQSTSELAHSLMVSADEVLPALVALEQQGSLMRGRFRPDAQELEWCERRLLARIHRRTLNKLRSEIEPLAPRDWVRFLTHWQRVAPGQQVEGWLGLAGVVQQLEGFEAPASSWESHVFPARVRNYQPELLDALCHSGRYVWARRTPVTNKIGTLSGPLRSTPLTFLSRELRSDWLSLNQGAVDLDELSVRARLVYDCLSVKGAVFFDEIQQMNNLEPKLLSQALGELVSRGLVTSDGFQGLRALLQPIKQRLKPSGWIPVPAHSKSTQLSDGGRWSLLPTSPTVSELEALVWVLIRRWGVLFRALWQREGKWSNWQDILRILRKLEAQGHVRGGRFVQGFSGEQFSLPEALTMLRDVRKQPTSSTELISLSAVDPLNVLPLLSEGTKLPAQSSNQVFLRDGNFVAYRVGAELRLVGQIDPVLQPQLQHEIVKKCWPVAHEIQWADVG
jgi:ATP-dependent helicase Lhr and Lhr-like helicase